jgi:hypothetical protein
MTVIFRPGQRVTDADGNRATFLRMGDRRNGFNVMYNAAIVRYVGERHESMCPAHDLRPGWSVEERA